MGVGVRHSIVTAIRGDHGQRVLLTEAYRQIVGAGPGDTASYQHERSLCLLQQTHRFPNSLRVRQLRVRTVGLGGAMSVWSR